MYMLSGKDITESVFKLTFYIIMGIDMSKFKIPRLEILGRYHSSNLDGIRLLGQPMKI